MYASQRSHTVTCLWAISCDITIHPKPSFNLIRNSISPGDTHNTGVWCLCLLTAISPCTVGISFEVEVLSFCTIAGPVITSQGVLVKELRVTKVFLCEMIIHTIALQPVVAKSNVSARCAYDVTNACTVLKLYMKNLGSGKCLVPCVYYFLLKLLLILIFPKLLLRVSSFITRTSRVCVKQWRMRIRHSMRS